MVGTNVRSVIADAELLIIGPHACGRFLPLPSRFLELVLGMDKVLARQRLVALEARGELDILVGLLVRCKGLRAFGGHSRLLCHLLTSPPRSRALRPAQSGFPDASEISRGKIDRFHRTPAGFTTPALDGRGLRDHLLARPAG